MIIIQEASAKVSDKLNGLKLKPEALKDLSNKVANLENGRESNREKSQINKAPYR